MTLLRFSVQGIRNLEAFTLDCSTRLNVIVGDNAAGKSAILEALHILGTGRSFRSLRFKDVINHKRNDCLLTGLIDVEEEGRGNIPLGYRRKGAEVDIHVNRQKVKKNSVLAQHFPLRIIHPESDELIIGSPSFRRRYIDWGVFHVEQQFHKVWRDYNHALKQRNAALKSRQSADLVKVWDDILARTGSALHCFRQSYIEVLKNHIDILAKELFSDVAVTVEYRAGWEQSRSLGEALQQHLLRDMKQGYTGDGPHRADLRILVNDRQAMDMVSRGQLKTLVVLLTLAQIRQFSLTTGKSCALLFDDIASELDRQHREKVLSTLSMFKVQLFITCINSKSLELPDTYAENLRMFHVEHGQLQDIS